MGTRDEMSVFDRGTAGKPEYLVSAIVSVYDADEFLAGCLDDLLAQTIADRIEIIVIDSASPGREGDIAREYRERHPNIRYLRTDRRETIYAAWNRGVRMATAPYLTNANADDRHRQDALEILVRALEENPEAVLAYAPYYETPRKNDAWDSDAARKRVDPPKFRRGLLLLRCFVGPQPVWRRSLHDEIGMFDDRLAIAGDYEFWLRAAERHRFVHVPEILGLYYASPTGSNAAARDMSRNRGETAAVRDRYLRRYLARLDPPVSVIVLGDRPAADWHRIFAGLREQLFFASEIAAVTGCREEAEKGWEESGGAQGGLKVFRRFSAEMCRATTGDYVVVVPPDARGEAELLGNAVEDVDEGGFRAGIFIDGSGDLICWVYLGTVFRAGDMADRLLSFTGGERADEIPLPPGVEAVTIVRRGWHLLRSGLSRSVRLSELDAIEHAHRKGRNEKGVPGALIRGEAGFWKELLLRGEWRGGRAGWIRSAIRGWTDFLKEVYASEKPDE
jgi:glycosyltransferase involved in cell wall biosynthesis